MLDCRIAIGTPDNCFAINRRITWKDLELSLSKKLSLLYKSHKFYQYFSYHKRTWGKKSNFTISIMLKIDNTDGFALFIGSSWLAPAESELDDWLETFKFLGMKKMTRIVLTTENDAEVMRVACCLKNILYRL